MALTQDSFAEIITAAGPLDDGILQIVDVDQDVYLVTFAEAEVEIAHDEQAELAVFSVMVGRVPAEREGIVYQALLTANALWRDTGGVCMAVADGDVMMHANLATSTLNARLVATVAANLASRAASWRAVLDGTGAEEAALLPDSASEMAMIRV